MPGAFGEQRFERLDPQWYVATVTQQDVGQAGDQGLPVLLGAGQGQAGTQQAHAAIDVGADGSGNDEVRRTGDDGADRGDAAGMEVRRGAGLADVPGVAGCLDRGEVEQLAHGLFLQREAGGQQDLGRSTVVTTGEGDDVLLAVDEDAAAQEGFQAGNVWT